MSIDIGKRAIDFFLNNRIYQNERSFFSFLGGEPLLAFSLIKKLVEYTLHKYSSKKIKFLILSNGALLNKEIAEFIKDNNIKIRITCNNLDGELRWDKIQGLLSGYRYLAVGFLLLPYWIHNLYEHFLKIFSKGIKRFYFISEFLYSNWEKKDLDLLSKVFSFMDSYVRWN